MQTGTRFLSKNNSYVFIVLLFSGARAHYLCTTQVRTVGRRRRSEDGNVVRSTGFAFTKNGMGTHQSKRMMRRETHAGLRDANVPAWRDHTVKEARRGRSFLIEVRSNRRQVWIWLGFKVNIRIFPRQVTILNEITIRRPRRTGNGSRKETAAFLAAEGPRRFVRPFRAFKYLGYCQNSLCTSEIPDNPYSDYIGFHYLIKPEIPDEFALTGTHMRCCILWNQRKISLPMLHCTGITPGLKLHGLNVSYTSR